MTAPDVNADVRARFERRYSEDDVRACAKRMKFYDHQIAAAILTEYADKLAAHADLSGEVRELVEALKLARDYAAYVQGEPEDLAVMDAALAKFHPAQPAGDSK